MGASDWNEMDNSVADAVVKRGVTNGEARPPGGGDFVYGMRSIQSQTGAVALYCIITDFGPMAKGASISGCIKKSIGAGGDQVTPCLFLGAGDHDVEADCYMLGFEDDHPSRIVLAKGPLSGGIPQATETNSLRRSLTSVEYDWVHLRLDMIVNQTEGGPETILRCYTNDLNTNPLGDPPEWEKIAFAGGAPEYCPEGDDYFLDDALGANSGTLPLVSGYGGFGAWFADISRRCYFDYLRIARQL